MVLFIFRIYQDIVDEDYHELVQLGHDLELAAVVHALKIWHQLAPRHESSSSGSNDPIGDLEA
jgi:hypothetical protein